VGREWRGADKKVAALIGRARQIGVNDPPKETQTNQFNHAQSRCRREGDSTRARGTQEGGERKLCSSGESDVEFNGE